MKNRRPRVNRSPQTAKPKPSSTFHEKAGEEEATQAQELLAQAGPDSTRQISALAAADDETRSGAVAQLQRQQGNQYVQRLVRERAVQRQAAAAPAALLVDDTAGQPGPGQMRKSQFLARLKTEVCKTAEEALQGTAWSEKGCPYISYWFGYYEGREAAQIERALLKYAPEAAQVKSAQDYILLISERVRGPIKHWAATGQLTGLPPGAPVDLPGMAAPNVLGAAPGAANVPAAGPLQFKARDGGANEADAESVQAELGRGQPVDGSVGSRLGPFFGHDFSNVRVHTDPGAASLSADLNARAFTVGEHIAFGVGEYQPGTPVGDALIAHELAHVVQQGGARRADGVKTKGEPDDAPLEHAADMSAIGAVVSLWNGAQGAATTVAQNAIPRLRSGLRLSRCKVGGKPDTEELDDDNPYGFRITMNPEANPAVKGMEPTFGLTVNYPEANTFGVDKWQAVNPKGDTEFSNPHPRTFKVDLDEPGDWFIAVMVYGLTGSKHSLRGRTVTVIDPNQLAEEKLKNIPGVDYQKFRAGLVLKHVMMAEGGVPTQQSGTPNITSSGQNPAYLKQDFPYERVITFTIHPSPNAKRFTWRGGGAAAKNWPDKGTETTQEVIFSKEGVFDITCDEFDEKGQPLGTRATYIQAVQPQAQAERVHQWQKYMGEVQKQYEELEEGKEVPLRGVYVSRDSGETLPLSLYLGPHKKKNQWRLLDLTPGVDERVYKGLDARRALEEYKSVGKKQYPTGMIRVEVPAGVLKQTDPGMSMTFDTEIPESTAHWIARKTGLLSLGLTVLGVAALFVPGGQVVAPYLFAGAGATAAASSGASLVDRLQQKEVSGVGVAIDILGLASSIFGAIGSWKSLRAITRGAGLSNPGKYYLWAGFSADAVDGVLIGVDAWQEIDRIHDAKERGLITASQERDEIARVVGGLARTATLIAYGAQDLLTQASTRVGGYLEAETLTRLGSRGVGVLNMLDDVSLQTLQGRWDIDFESVVRLVEADPKRFNLLVKTYGTEVVEQAGKSAAKNLDELEAAVVSSRATAQGGEAAPGGNGKGPGADVPAKGTGTTAGTAGKTGGGDTPGGGTPTAATYGPFMHTLSKGGLDEIIRTGELRSSTARSVAGGGDAVRAHVGSPQLPWKGDVPAIEFMTYDKPRVAKYMGGDAAYWDLPEGDYLKIKIKRVVYPDGRVSVFHDDGTVTTTGGNGPTGGAPGTPPAPGAPGADVPGTTPTPTGVKGPVDTPQATGGPTPQPGAGKITSEMHPKYKDQTVYDVKKKSTDADELAEVRMAEYLVKNGHDVHFTQGVGETDLKVDGIHTDVKHLREAHPKNVLSAIQRGAKQGPQVLIDGTTVGLTKEQAEEGIKLFEEIAQKHPGPAAGMKKVMIVFSDGSVLVHTR